MYTHTGPQTNLYTLGLILYTLNTVGMLGVAKREPRVGSQRIDIEEFEIRLRSNGVFKTAAYTRIRDFIRKTEEEHTERIIKGGGLIPDLLPADEEFKRQMRKCSSALLMDLNLFDCEDLEGNQKRLQHMERSAAWFTKFNKPMASQLRRQMSMPAFLSFHREDLPLPGSRRVFHKNTILLRERAQIDPRKKMNHMLL